MKEAVGDLWTHPATIRVITTNGSLKANGSAVMGRGCALEAARRYPGIPPRLGGLLKRYGNVPFLLWLDREADCWVATMPVKHDWRRAADLGLIEESAHRLTTHLLLRSNDTVVVPRPGCGYGGRDWEREVRPILAPILDDRFTVITHPEENR